MEAAKTILETNPNALLFVLMPMPHSNVLNTSLVKNRRLLEDMLMKCHV